MEMTDYSISDNVRLVREKIRKAAQKANRQENEILLVGVSKTIDNERIRKAFEAGITEFGENKAQELCEKYGSLHLDCRWHFIGHLQTNKVKDILGKVSLIHSMDRIGLAEEIEKRAKAMGLVADALIQVNVAGEETKFGISPDQALEFAKQLSRFQNIHIQGLMTVAPKVDMAEDARAVFRELKQVFEYIKRETYGASNIHMKHLSMGMSGDYETAIEEGADIVRIGTAIFGQRQYNI